MGSMRGKLRCVLRGGLAFVLSNSILTAYLDCLGCAILFLEGSKFFLGGHVTRPFLKFNRSGPITLALFPIEEDFSFTFSSDFDRVIVFSK
jgi:hypothetical protein